MPKCVKTISFDAMDLFEISFDVAALLNSRVSVLKLWSSVWGPILSLKTSEDVTTDEANALRMDPSTENNVA